MKPKKPAITLHRHEWDFRTVSDRDLPAVILWEYARQSQRFCSAWDKWLDSKADGIRVRKRLITLHPIYDLHPLIQSLCGWVRSPDFISLAIPHFPKPWLSIPGPINHSMSDPRSPFMVVGKGRELFDRYRREEFNEYRHGMNYGFFLGFGEASVESIIDEFSRWAYREAKQHPRKRGKAQSQPWEQLKWLSTLRLSSVATYEASQDFLHRQPKVNHHSDVWPVYQSPGAWSNAKTDAQKTVQKIESILLG